MKEWEKWLVIVHLACVQVTLFLILRNNDSQDERLQKLETKVWRDLDQRCGDREGSER